MLTYHETTEREKYEIGQWRYEGDYAIYDQLPYEEALKKGVGLANPFMRRFSFYDGEHLVGMAALRETFEDIFFGIAVKPELCGRGYGLAITRLVILISQAIFDKKPLVLEVRTWNQRAIRCYEKAGFQKEGQPFVQVTGSGAGEFYRMIYSEDKNIQTLVDTTL